MNELGFPFHLDPVITDQFFGDFSNPGPAGPEKELLIAILADAIECYQKYSTSRNGVELKLFEEAREWIFAASDDAPLAFTNICDALRLDADYVRRRLRNQKSFSLTQRGKEIAGPARPIKRHTTASKRNGVKLRARHGRRSRPE